MYITLEELLHFSLVEIGIVGLIFTAIKKK